MSSASQGSRSSKTIPVVKKRGFSGSLTKDVNFDSDSQKDVKIPTQELVIKAGKSDEEVNLPFEKTRTLQWSTVESLEVFQNLPQEPHFRPLEQFDISIREGQAIDWMVNFCSVVERSSRLQFLNEPKSSADELLRYLSKLEENGFNVEVVREHIAMKEKLEKLREQYEEVKDEMRKHIIEKAEIEEQFEAMKEAKDQQIASLILEKLLLEQDIADVELAFQTSAASLGITGGVTLDLDIMSTEPNRRTVGLKACSNVRRNNQVLSTEVTSQVDILGGNNGDNLLSYNNESNDRRELVSAAKKLIIHNDLDPEKNPVGQSSSGAYGSLTGEIEGLLSRRKKLSEGSRSSSSMEKYPKKNVLKSVSTIPQIIDLEDENDSPEGGTIVQSRKAEEEILKSDHTIPEIIPLENECHERLAIVQPKCTPVRFSSFEAKSSRPIPSIYLEKDENQEIEPLQVLSNESDKILSSLGSGGQLELESGETVHQIKGGRPRKFAGGCMFSGNNGVVEEKPGSSGSGGPLPMRTGEEVHKSKEGRPRKLPQGSEKPDCSEGDGQLQMKTAAEKVQKRKGGTPRNADGFVIPCYVTRMKKKRRVVDHSLPTSKKGTKEENAVQENLLGCRIKVWWPDDQQYYEGIIESYNPAKKKHKVAYFDGDVEHLRLEKEEYIIVNRPENESKSSQDEEKGSKKFKVVLVPYSDSDSSSS